MLMFVVLCVGRNLAQNPLLRGSLPHSIGNLTSLQIM